MSLHIAIDPTESEPGSRLVVCLEGLLNSQGAETAHHYLRILLDQQTKPVHVLLEGSKLTYLNSSGLRTLSQFSRELRKSGKRLALCCASEQLTDLVEVAGLSTLILMYPSVDEARQALVH
ncbi:MAG: STAS domain-containing protein [Candidatus Methylacidiphilales bacterium]|nr:STAS domain-containing protein [Candidatus Methylacidiphilales bacterium]